MKVDKPLVSIVIPVYNVESYLEECLESVEAQSYANFECIMIIDGATDRSYDIAKKYCENHPRFKVFYQENSGSGPARNNGVAHSSGEFICFIDPDDWVEKDYVESMLLEQQRGNYDLVISQSIDRKINSDNIIVETKENNKPIITFTSKEECRENFPTIMFKLHYLDGPICKLFRASIIRDNIIEFPAYRRSQDMVFNFRYYNHICSISTISRHTYNIRNEYPPKPGRGRVFTGYHEIVAKIYAELLCQLKSWNIKAQYFQLLNTWSYWYLYASIQLNVLANKDYGYIAEEPYKSIILNARPTLLLQRVIRFLLAHRMNKVATIAVKLSQKIK